MRTHNCAKCKETKTGAVAPRCCQNCSHLRPSGACDCYQNCGKWLSWFREQWQDIRKATALIIANRELKKEKTDEEGHE